MSSNTEAAQRAADEAKDQVIRTIAESRDAFRNTVAGALDSMVTETILKQPGITDRIEDPDLTVLKINLAQSIESAIASIDKTLSDIDIDALAGNTRRSVTGQQYLQVSRILSPLLKVTGDLLEQAGYDMEVAGKMIGGGYNPSLMTGVDFTAGTAATKIDHAIEKYGKALHAVDDAVTVDAEAKARDRWNRA